MVNPTTLFIRYRLEASVVIVGNKNAFEIVSLAKRGFQNLHYEKKVLGFKGIFSLISVVLITR